MEINYWCKQRHGSPSTLSSVRSKKIEYRASNVEEHSRIQQSSSASENDSENEGDGVSCANDIITDGKGYMEGKGSVVYRAFNILDVYAIFMGTYCRLNSVNNIRDIASASKESFHSIYAVTQLLKMWITALVQ